MNLNFLRRVLIYTNIYLALGAGLVSFGFAFLLAHTLDYIVFIASFLMTFALYGLNRLTDINEDTSNNIERVSFVSQYKNRLAVLLFLAYVLAMFLAISKNVKSFFVMFVILVVGALYSVSVIPHKGGFIRLKNIILVKNLTIGLVWSLALVIFPLTYLESKFDLLAVILFIFIMLRLLLNTVLFDLRDIAGDKRARVNTVPVLFGKYNTIRFLIILNVATSILLFLPAIFGLVPAAVHLINLSTLYVFFYIYLIDKIDINVLCDFVVDGEFIFIGLLALSSKVIAPT